MSGIVIPVGMAGGGGAELDITAYSAVGSLPTSADEGAVAIITTTAINVVHAAADEPTPDGSGDVWIWLGDNQLVDIDIGSNILLPPKAAFQYISSAWTYIESYVYHSGAWVEVTLYVYDTGDFYLVDSYSAVSYGGNNYSQVTISLESGFIKYLCTGTGDRETRYGWTTTLVDLTDVDTIRFSYSTTGAIDCCNFKVSTTRTNSAAASAAGTYGASQTKDLDVSSLTGEYYIGLEGGRSSTGSANVDSITITSILLIRS